ncbi:hypothetical protein [Marinactinospora rubrisoli]|uniref:Uncharacterized protein n=1 Tax=Marinactinospora rubrisoli TaxID=2715399 RepID=A0ABW2KN28_9ACTN
MTLAAKIAAQRMRRVYRAAVAAQAADSLARTPRGWTWQGAPMDARTPGQVIAALMTEHGLSSSAALHAIGHAQQRAAREQRGWAGPR